MGSGVTVTPRRRWLRLPLLGLAVVATALALAGRRDPATDRWLLLAAGIGLTLLGGRLLLLLRERDGLVGALGALRQRSERLAAAVAQARDGVMLFDPGGRLQLWNEQASAATGLPPDLFRRSATLAQLATATAHWPGAPLADARPVADQPAVETRVGERVLEV